MRFLSKCIEDEFKLCAVNEGDAGKRARETSRQTGQRIPNKKSPTNRCAQSPKDYRGFVRRCWLKVFILGSSQ